MNEDTTTESSAPPKSRTVDPFSLVAGLVFATAGIVGLIGEPLADIDLVVLAGVALVAIGVGCFVVVLLRSRTRRRSVVPNQDQQSTDS